MKTAEYWIEKLELLPHPEGGFFKEVYRSSESVNKEHLPERFSGERNFSTSIYFLLKSDNFSSFHRIRSDEVWHFYEGSPVMIYMINEKGELNEVLIGRDPDKGEKLQYTVPAGDWFAAEVIEEDSYSLVGCTVSPGFHFEDFELAEKDLLVQKYPQHKKIITRLTR
jgi:uncharacterized protein